MQNDKPYPDLTEILARKERGRRGRARLLFAEKLDMLDQLRKNETLLGGLKMRRAVPTNQQESD